MNSTLNRPDVPSWAVLGAGMLGCTLAWRLAARGCKVSLIEAAPELGGLTADHHFNDVHWDRYYHVIDAGDVHLRRLLDEIGLADAIEWRTTQTLFFDGRALHPLNDAFDYLRLPALGLIDKLRVAATITLGARWSSADALESEPAAAWLTRWSGRGGYAGLWQPLLRSKLGANHDQVSAAYIHGVIRRFYGARHGTTRKERFGFVPGGYTRIVKTFAAALTRVGVNLLTASPVRSVEQRTDGTFELALEHTRLQFDRVVATFASPLAARTIGLPEAERAAHAQLKYQGVVCLSLLLRRPLGGAYMTYITDDRIPFTTVIEMSALTGTQIFGGHHLVYLPKYVPSDDPMLQADEASIRATFIAGLRRMYPDFRDEDIVTHRLARAPHVLALPTLDYSRHLPAIATSKEGLYICNSAQIRSATLSVNEAVALADRAAAESLP